MDVYFNQNFWYHGQTGEKTGIFKELNAKFQYGNFEWRVPAAYCFEQGFTLDICRRIPQDMLQNFFDVWKMYIDDEGKLTPSQSQQIERENPQNFKVNFDMELDGRQARPLNGCGLCWQPCLPEYNNPEAEEPVVDYALDKTDGWEILRFSFLWPKDYPHMLNNPYLTLCAQRITLPCDVQFTSQVGGASFTVPFCHPRNKETYSIEIIECKSQHVSLPQNQEEKCKWPEYVCILEYRVNPALPDGEILSLRDCIEDDPPVCPAGGHLDGAAAFGIISSRPDSYAVMPPFTRSAKSALHFAPVTHVEWQAELQTVPFTPESFPL